MLELNLDGAQFTFYLTEQQLADITEALVAGRNREAETPCDEAEHEGLDDETLAS